MLELKRCVPCGGSGQIMGGGMIMKDCFHCEGAGKISVAKEDLEYLHLKTTDSYKNAIEKIKKTDETITDTEAEQVFKDELEKLREKPNLGNRRRER